jgi:hypothetical protein
LHLLANKTGSNSQNLHHQPHHHQPHQTQLHHQSNKSKSKSLKSTFGGLIFQPFTSYTSFIYPKKSFVLFAKSSLISSYISL